jgi:type IV pilus biogenesis protein CpaD/CtpE
MKKREVAASLIALLAGCATPKAGTIPMVPDNLKVPPTQTLSLETHAIGVQIYECKPNKDDPTRFEWVFQSAGS